MAKHTPGPWNFFTDKPAYSVGPSHNHSVARVFNPPGGERDEIIANARLIAAAPELLKALQALQYLYNGMDSCVELTPKVMMAARAAIAKATK